jgi:hypothetical protein
MKNQHVKFYTWPWTWIGFLSDLISLNGYSLPNIIRAVKSRSMRWATHVAHMGEMRNIYRIWEENLKGRDHLENVVEYVRIILKWTLERNGVRGCGLDASVSGYGPVVCSC